WHRDRIHGTHTKALNYPNRAFPSVRFHDSMVILEDSMIGRSSRLSFALALFAGPAWLSPAIAAPAPSTPVAQDNSGVTEVDVELALGVDISFSMDPDEQELQREGYIQALTSNEFLSALKEGAHGKIAVTYYEWANVNERRVIVPWRLIDGPEAAD